MFYETIIIVIIDKFKSSVNCSKIIKISFNSGCMFVSTIPLIRKNFKSDGAFSIFHNFCSWFRTFKIKKFSDLGGGVGHSFGWIIVLEGVVRRFIVNL